MPLQVWLPLLGNLDNQGLEDISITNNGATVDNSGKLGQCYSFGTSTSYLILSNNAINKCITECSLSMWLNIITWNTSYATYFQAGLGGAPWAHYIFGVLRNGSNSNLCFTISNGSTASNASYTTPTLTLNIWYHLTFVYKTGHCLIYINGELYKDYATTIVPNFNGITKTTVGACNNGSYQTNCKLNDVRIYNHALSPKEVKLLSQGLVAHYQLNDAYLEGTTNLASKPDCLSSTCYNGAKGTYGYGTNTDMYKTVGVFEGKLCSKLYMGTSGASARPYPYISNLFVSNGTNAPAYKTLSFDYFSTIGTYINPYKLGSGTATCNWTNPSASPSSGTFTNSGNIPIVAGKWNHITMILHGTTDTNAEWGYIVMGDTHTSNTSNYWLFANMQLEEKDHATGYTDSTRSESIVYDSSGFNNHTTAVGSPTISSDTVRNIVSTHFINGQYALAQQNANLYLPKDSLTVNLWIKCSTWGNPISCTEGGGWNFEDIGSGLRFPAYISGVGYKIANSGISPSTLLNAWHMLTGTFDGTTLRIYVDAQIKGTTSTGSTNGIGYAANRLVISGEAQGATPASSSYVGEISDVRIYATALSEDDIKTLYNAPVSVANNGTMITQGEFVEV